MRFGYRYGIVRSSRCGYRYGSPMILVTASGKGGVGKTTTAATLYAAAESAHLRAQLVNVDPQRSLLRWLGEDVVLHRPELSRADQLSSLDEPGVLTIVDTPPGTAPQALAAWQAADVLVGCTGPTTIELEGLADLAERLGGVDRIDAVVVGRFDSRSNHGHAVVELARRRWGAARVVVYPARVEVANAYDQRRSVAPSSPVSFAASDLLARVLDMPAAAALAPVAHG